MRTRSVRLIARLLIGMLALLGAMGGTPPRMAAATTTSTTSQFVIAANAGLSTQAGQAVFWSGIRGGDSAAASWAAKNGGTTLEQASSARGVSLPAFDSANPSSVAAWRQASAQFAQGARGDVTVLQGDAVRIKSVWAQVEHPALQANPAVTSITPVNPATGSQVLLWSR